jgi:hypothetical protein
LLTLLRRMLTLLCVLPARPQLSSSSTLGSWEVKSVKSVLGSQLL